MTHLQRVLLFKDSRGPAPKPGPRPLHRELEARLKALGYAAVGIALSGEEAIQAASELQPDIVLMDIVLKGSLDGIAAVNEPFGVRGSEFCILYSTFKIPS